MNIKRIQLIQGKGELNSRAGNYFSGLVLGKLPRRILPTNFHTRRSDAIIDRDILLTQIGLLCNGNTDFNDVEQYKGDRLFTAAYGIKKLPSEATLRQRLDEMPQERTHGTLRRLNLELLRKRKQELGRVDAGGLELVPVDMDVSPMDNSRSCKQRSSRTYKGFEGFAPMLAYIGLPGYMLDCELREGKQHCQNGTPQTIVRVLEQIRGLGLSGQCLIRMDSGNDAVENLDLLKGQYFIIKRNLRKEYPEQWLALARRVGECRHERPGKNVYTGFAHHLHPGGDERRPCVPVAFKVVERITDRDGQQFLTPELEVSTYWANLPCSAQRVVELYQAHGTSEQFHSELKSDLDIERLPSEKFCVNQIVLLCGMVAFNVLRTIGQAVVSLAKHAPKKIKVSRWRLKTVLQDVVYSACRIVSHAGRFVLNFGSHCPWFGVYSRLPQALE